MKKFLTLFFITLGVIFFVLILIAAYLYLFDPLHLRTSTVREPVTTEKSVSGETTPATDANPLLSPTQEKALETFGVDPATVPTSISPAQEACFVEILGEARVNEIKAGDAPTPLEFLKAKSCI